MYTKEERLEMRIDPALKKRLQSIADREHRKLSNLVEKVLLGHVEWYEKKDDRKGSYEAKSFASFPPSPQNEQVYEKPTIEQLKNELIQTTSSGQEIDTSLADVPMNEETLQAHKKLLRDKWQNRGKKS